MTILEFQIQFGQSQLLLMKRGGQLIYSGSLGPLSSNMIKYFEVTLPDMDVYICKMQREENNELLFNRPFQVFLK